MTQKTDGPWLEDPRRRVSGDSEAELRTAYRSSVRDEQVTNDQDQTGGHPERCVWGKWRSMVHPQ